MVSLGGKELKRALLDWHTDNHFPLVLPCSKACVASGIAMWDRYVQGWFGSQGRTNKPSRRLLPLPDRSQWLWIPDTLGFRWEGYGVVSLFVFFFSLIVLVRFSCSSVKFGICSSSGDSIGTVLTGGNCTNRPNLILRV